MSEARSGAIRVLCLSNYFPPFAQGGYEQWCYEIAAALVQRGHVVDVLTSGASATADRAIAHLDGIGVHRRLHLEVEGGVIRTGARLLFERHTIERHNLEQLRSVIEQVRPDVALIWGMWNVPRSVPSQLEQLLPGGVMYYFCDYWPTLPSAYVQLWEAPARRAAARVPKRLIGQFALARLRRERTIFLKLERPLCVSHAVRRLLVEANIPVEHAEVVYGGTRLLDAARKRRSHERGLRLLYAGRLTPTKGVHTAIRALGQLGQERAVTLSIVGGGDAHYAQDLRRLARACGVADRVAFGSRVSDAEMPSILADHDVLVLPSIWDEPFARIVLEAMAAGLVVVGTTTGGTGEILVEGETGLTFPSGNALALADQVRRLLADSSLRTRLARAGQERVRREFSLSRMADQLERHLSAVADRQEA